MRFDFVFWFYSSVLGFLVGVIAAAFLLLTDFFIRLIWTEIPAILDFPAYPLIIGLIGGICVGLIQKYLGDYPPTLHDTLKEFKETGAVNYKRQIGKTFFAAVVVLSFGASIGPEAALAGILGGLISWLGDQLKLTIKKKSELLELGLGAMLATIFYAPFAGIGMEFEEHRESLRFKSRWIKIFLYGTTALWGIAGFNGLNHFFPREVVFALHFPEITWDSKALWLVLPAVAVGIFFGFLFLFLERAAGKIAEKISRPILLGIIGGLFIGVFSLLSPYFLFSGEHQLIGFSEIALDQSVNELLLLGTGKAVLTVICFSFGWKGGTIFPAIFSSTAIGFALANTFPFMPGLIVGLVVAASVTIILDQPYVTAAILLFLFPVPFFPAILMSCIAAKKLKSRIL